MTLGRCRLGNDRFHGVRRNEEIVGEALCEVYLKSQQAQFVADIRKALGGTQQ